LPAGLDLVRPLLSPAEARAIARRAALARLLEGPKSRIALLAFATFAALC
jgi:hypothetical protein